MATGSDHVLESEFEFIAMQLGASQSRAVEHPTSRGSGVVAIEVGKSLLSA